MALEEAPAYHDAFEVQTLGYRAPEVIYGVPFGSAIDIWSLGVTLAELYSGCSFLHAASRGGLAVELAQLFGQPPPALFPGAKYASELLPLVAHTEAALPLNQRRQRLSIAIGAPTTAEAQLFVDLVARLLAYDPGERLSASEALCHPFIAPAFPFHVLVLPTVGPAHDAHQVQSREGIQDGFKGNADADDMTDGGALSPAASQLAGNGGGSCGSSSRAPKRKLATGAVAGAGVMFAPRSSSRPRPAAGGHGGLAGSPSQDERVKELVRPQAW